MDNDEVKDAVIEHLKYHKLVATGDMILFTRGEQRGQMGGTNMMEIVKVD
jgi:pyruvate kinase